MTDTPDDTSPSQTSNGTRHLVDLDALSRHLTAIEVDDEGPFVWGSFEQTWLAVRLALQPATTDPLYWTGRHLSAVGNRLEDLRTVAAKLQWMLEQLREGSLDKYAWMYFAASDIVSFLTTTRSLLDHVARALVSAAPKPGSIPKYSFRGLSDWLSKNPARREQLGGASAIVVEHAQWFGTIRDVRDTLIHQDARTIVFPTADGIQFQVYEGVDLLIQEQGILLADNVASFEHLAAAIAARVHELTSDAATAIAAALQLELDRENGWSRHTGIGVIRSWTQDLLHSA